MMRKDEELRTIRKESAKQSIRLNERRMHGIFFQIAFELPSHREVIKMKNGFSCQACFVC